jgi:hypothetical protein
MGKGHSSECYILLGERIEKEGERNGLVWKKIPIFRDYLDKYN